MIQLTMTTLVVVPGPGAVVVVAGVNVVEGSIKQIKNCGYNTILSSLEL